MGVLLPISYYFSQLEAMLYLAFSNNLCYGLAKSIKKIHPIRKAG